MYLKYSICVHLRFFFTHPHDGSNSEWGLGFGDRQYVQTRKLSNIICDNIQDGLRYLYLYHLFLLYRMSDFIIISVINENVMDLDSDLMDCSTSSTQTEGKRKTNNFT